MRIAMVSEHANPLATLGGVDAGGQNVHVAELAGELGRRGHQVVVHSRRDDPSVARRVALSHGVVVDHVPAGPARPVPKDHLLGYMEAFAAELAQAWRRHRPDIVHAHFWMSGKAALAAARPLGIPVVQTFHALGTVKRRHQGKDDTSPPERLAVEQAVAWGVDRIIATCSDESFELTRMGVHPARISVVPCGVDLATFGPEGPSMEGPSLPHRLAMVGRLVPRKGTAEVIAALVEVPGAELAVAGGPAASELASDPDARRIAELAQRAGVADRVHLLGRLDRRQVAALLRSSDLAVTAPWYEPFGMVPLEAMACGVPVVATSVGGLVDSVIDGLTGLHVPPRQPGELAAAIRRLLDDAALRRRMGQLGAARAKERYGWPGIAAATERLYRHLVGHARPVAEVMA